MDIKKNLNPEEQSRLELASKEIIDVLDKYNLYIYSNFYHRLVLSAGKAEIVIESERIA